MKHKKRSAGFILTILCTCTLLLTACGTSNLSSTSHYTPHKTIKFTDEKSTVIATVAPTATSSAKATYVGEALNQHAWIGLSSNDNSVVAFVTDGAKDHPATFAQWFRGPITNKAMDLTATDKTGDDHLQAMLANDTASGTVTLANGKSFAFTAKAVTPSDGDAGLYRGDRIVNGEHYAAGWVLMPESMAPPSGTAPETPGPAATNALPQGGAISNQKTYALLPTPELTSQEIQTQEVTVPDLGAFKLLQCQQTAC